MHGRNIVVLDLETARSADDCRHCNKPESQHYDEGACEFWIGEKPADTVNQFSPIGWRAVSKLGISVGCYWDYRDSRIHWFDEDSLLRTVQHLTDRQALLVSFNGIQFDFVVMRGLLRRQAESLPYEEAMPIAELCDQFKTLCTESYDILVEVWKADPEGKRVRGVNSLDTICQANGLGAKLSNGAQAPRDWALKKWADVLNYCQDDVYKTKALFEWIVESGGVTRRTGRPALLLPELSEAQQNLSWKSAPKSA